MEEENETKKTHKMGQYQQRYLNHYCKIEGRITKFITLADGAPRAVCCSCPYAIALKRRKKNHEEEKER